MENTRVVTIAGAKVTVVDKFKVKHRNQLRRAYRIAKMAGAEHDTANEFGLIVARTLVIDGDLWKPPSGTASTEELLDGYLYMLENVTGELIDQWLTATEIRLADPETSPLPLAEDADPNE